MSRISGIRLLVAAVTLVVAVTVAAAIAVLGPPSQQRQLRLDNRRVADLIAIKEAIAFYVNQHDALPSDLAALARQAELRIKRTDPETGAPYEYASLGGRSYRLCAVFAAKSETGQIPARSYNEPGWGHGSGRQCFDRREAARKE